MSLCLVITDIQVDFVEGGALAVPGGNEVAEAVAEYVGVYGHLYDKIVTTRDWHLPNDSNGGHFDTWPVHCVQNTPGAEYHPAIRSLANEGYIDEEFLKGQGCHGYSGFDGVSAHDWSLDEYLHKNSIEYVEVCGLATDFCVAATARDAKMSGYRTVILSDLSAGIDDDNSRSVIREING